jgi:poly-gamma-glutamate synthesis protein (capsule biosynthesis protein)
MHWGVHFETGTIAQYQVEAGHAAMAAGADAILGHHPHIIKGIEYYNGKPILYGMPNFNLGVRDEHEERDPRWLTLESEKSFIAKFRIASKRIEKLSLIPCHLDGSTRQPEPLSGSDPRTADLVRYLEYVDSHNTPQFWSGTGAGAAFGPFQTKYRLDGDEIVVEP